VASIPYLERFVAKQMGATTLEAASGHVPMLCSSDPQGGDSDQKAEIA
jgi:hypothetical protein